MKPLLPPGNGQVSAAPHSGQSPPLSFVFSASLQSSIVTSSGLPPSCKHTLPNAIPVWRQWPGGFMVEQTLAFDDYGVSLVQFTTNNDLVLEPEAMMNFNTIQYTLRGNSHCLLRGHGIIPLLQHSYTPLYIPIGRHKVWFKPGEYVFLYIVISTGLLQELALEHAALKTLIDKILSSSTAGAMMERLLIDTEVLHIIRELEASTKTGAGLRLEIQAIIIRLLAVYNDHLHKVKINNFLQSSHEIACKINDFICRHINDPYKVNNETLTREFSLSTSTLERCFKKYFGITPADYIRDLRLEIAQDLLLTKRSSISEASMLAGYEHVSSFSREFKKKFGYAPSSQE